MLALPEALLAAEVPPACLAEPACLLSLMKSPLACRLFLGGMCT